ncbi:MAG TPA: hypothetical protein DEP84_15085 [Chloroflexi bacterium]|nr:hypothetical protein [Chloroflexota bacterium]
MHRILASWTARELTRILMRARLERKLQRIAQRARLPGGEDSPPGARRQGETPDRRHGALALKLAPHRLFGRF